ncbi:hypothetical protein WR25_20440 [Diploscapter pachys]|uniref:Uncharacterized protein n=1 Tax=Diploscapter pachys TaxID=2018661 RepID=A0A2A2M467_9BILA|nr:hypothetical protein WR25_20440 [Diploscapter pachys]
MPRPPPVRHIALLMPVVRQPCAIRVGSSGAASSPPRWRRSSATSPSIAPRAISAIGWRIVVSSGQIAVDSTVSSKPQTVRSPGTSSPRRCATATVAAAMSSFDEKIAVGGSARSSSCSAASSPDR